MVLGRPDDFEPASDLNDIPEEIRTIILEGGREYEGESGARFAVMIQMFQAGFDEGRIKQIISNPNFYIAPKMRSIPLLSSTKGAISGLQGRNCITREQPTSYLNWRDDDGT